MQVQASGYSLEERRKRGKLQIKMSLSFSVGNDINMQFPDIKLDATGSTFQFQLSTQTLFRTYVYLRMYVLHTYISRA